MAKTRTVLAAQGATVRQRLRPTAMQRTARARKCGSFPAWSRLLHRTADVRPRSSLGRARDDQNCRDNVRSIDTRVQVRIRTAARARECAAAIGLEEHIDLGVHIAWGDEPTPCRVAGQTVDR